MQTESALIVKRGVKCNGYPIPHLMRVKIEQTVAATICMTQISRKSGKMGDTRNKL